LTCYLTFNDGPSGIYSGQVIDVVAHLRRHFDVNLRLIALISLRGYRKNRQAIKSQMKDAIVLPMVPGVHRWRLNSMMLRVVIGFLRPRVIIGRSVLATILARRASRKAQVVYDGRGAIAAEWTEYNVVRDERLRSQILQLECKAVNDSDFRIAVSSRLVKYWSEKCGYTGNCHVLIPCTLNSVYIDLQHSENMIARSRNALGFGAGDVVIGYSGSLAGWQGIDQLVDVIRQLMQSDHRVKALFLSHMAPAISELERQFPGRVVRSMEAVGKVPEVLMAADYGLLLRERSVTNQVASPVKFAEYLACGLKILISPEIGDFSDFVSLHGCGHVFPEIPELSPVPFTVKSLIRKIGLDHFSKSRFNDAYRKVITGGK
jgi:hypothetical protein